MTQATASHGLIQRLKEGDREAFTPLFEMYAPRLAVLIHYRMSAQLRALVEVDDLIQETMLRAFRQLDQFAYRGPGSFLHWLSRIAEHVVVDEARFHGREKRRAADAVPLRSESRPEGADPRDSQTPSRIFARNEMLERLVRALEGLPEAHRQGILLSRIEGPSTEEVAARLGRSREAAAVLLHRALQSLRRSLGAARES
jgi:RNA polymerase sigma-70 factor, ECF subfamily